MVTKLFPKTRRGRLHPQAGVTLVELLITMVIAGLVTSSTFMFFAGQKQVYETQTKLLNIQQNLWGAMETLTRNIRAAGTGMVGCVRPDPDLLGPDNGDPPPVSGPGNTPPLTGLRAFLNPAVPQYPLGAARIAPLWIQNGPNGLPDSVVVAYGVGTSGNFTDARLAPAFVMPVGTPNMNVTVALGSGAAFRPKEFILMVDNSPLPVSGNLDRGCTLLQINDVAAGSDLLNLTTGGLRWNPTAPVAAMVPYAYDATNSGVRNFGQLNWIRFSIDTTGAIPLLVMTRLDDATVGAQTLAEGIEDMQIAYACDTRGAAVGSPADGVLWEVPDITDEWVYNALGDVPPITGCNRPQAIRITLLARSVTPDENLRGIATNQKAAIEDGIVGPVDMFRHRSISTTVFPRN